MDSLYASYASSDDEEEAKGLNAKPSSNRGGALSSMPPPKSSLFNSLPPPKSQSAYNPSSQPKFDQQKGEISLGNSKPKSSSSSLFSSMPRPKSSLSSASSSNSKKVVEFRPPTINTSSSSFDDEDAEDDVGEKERQRKRMKESASASSGFNLPAPRFSTSLGTLGSGRRSMLETGNQASAVIEHSATANDASQSNSNPAVENMGHQSDYSSQGLGAEGCAYHGAYVAGDGDNVGFMEANTFSIPGNDNLNSAEMGYDYSTGNLSVNYTNSDDYNAGDGVDVGSEAVDYSYGNVQHVDYTNAGSSYLDYANNPQCENSWTHPTAMPDVSEVIHEFQVPMKRGRKDYVPQIIEVKQDELVKNRPREDQVRSTGIAFGPAYQPASSKGKPTKLHKRKHQISSLYFDMRQKETELAERRSRGYQTKAQTQGKYGW